MLYVCVSVVGWESVAEAGDWALHEVSGPSTMALPSFLCGHGHRARKPPERGKTPRPRQPWLGNKAQKPYILHTAAALSGLWGFFFVSFFFGGGVKYGPHHCAC